MRRRKNTSFRHQPRHWVHWLLLGLVVLLILGMVYACTAQQMIYSSHGTMIFLPDTSFG